MPKQALQSLSRRLNSNRLLLAGACSQRGLFNMAHARRLIHAIAVAVCVVALSLTPVQAVNIGYDDLCAGYPRVVPRSSVSFVGYDLEPTVESAAVFVRHLLGRVVITASGTADVAPSIGATELELESLGFRLRGVFMKHDSVAVSPFGDSSFFVSSSATLQCKSYCELRLSVLSPCAGSRWCRSQRCRTSTPSSLCSACSLCGMRAT